MPIKFTVYKGKEHTLYLEQEMEQEEIKIGRDETNHIVLSDDKKIISREHAHIKFENDTYYLSDVGSRNGTFINKNRLKPNYPYVLDDASEFSLGDYIVRITLTQPQPQRVEETVFLSNPYQPDVQALVNLLTAIEEKYQNQDPALRDDFLKQALEDKLDHLKTNKIIKLLLTDDKQTKKISVRSADNSHINQIVDILLNLIVKLVQVISKFRTEFVGATLIQTKERIQMNSRDDLINYLLTPSLSEEQFAQRLSLLKDEIEKVIIHQVALLDGYSGGIQEGVPELLKEFNPAIIKNELLNKSIKIGPLNIPAKYIPLLSDLKTLKEIQNKLYHLSQEDRGVFEKKYFRSAFIRRYLENISLSQKSHSRSKG
jgi:hypothetical protein